MLDLITNDLQVGIVFRRNVNPFYRCLFLFLFTFIYLISTSQEQNDMTLLSYEDSLKTLFNQAFMKDSIRFIKSDKEKAELNQRILILFHKALQNENSFYYQFDSLKNVSILFSNDKLVKIYTWNLKFKNCEYVFFGFVQYFHKKKNEYLVFDLTDNTKNIIDPENATLNSSNWYGSLYYEIIDEKVQNETYYTLLGWKGNNQITNKKVIETLYFTSSGKLVFGKSIIRIERKSKKRLIFEYSIKTTMMLKYNSNLSMIIFDHLSPTNTSLMGLYQYYGTDGTYDGLKFENDLWLFYSNLRINTNLIIGNPTTKTVRDQ
jgi:hypothetical protein